MKRSILAFIFLLVGVFVIPLCWADTVRMGISSRVPNVNEELLQNTINSLKEKFKDQNFEVVNYSLRGLEQAIKKGEVDFFHSSAGLYRRLNDQGVRDIVALSSPRFPDPNRSEGTAFIVKAGREDLNSIESLKGKVLVANSKTGFSGYQVGQYEIFKKGFDPESFFGKELFVGESDKMRHVLEAVKDGTADVGYLRLCYLEDMAEDLGFKKEDFKVIEDKKNGTLSCSHTSSLYPSWTISTTTRISPQNARLLLLSLLEIPPTSKGVQWSPASDYHTVDQLFKDLRLGPWAYLREWTLERFLQQYWPWIMLLICGMFGLIAHGIRSEKLIRKRTLQLELAHAKQTEILKQAKEASSRLDRMQKVGAIGQMSSMLAHELRQPIATIQLYGRGLLRFIEGGPSSIEANSARLHQAVRLINEQCLKMNSIIEKVRNYAKAKSVRRQAISLKMVIIEAVRNFEISRNNQVKVRLNAALDVFVKGDALELELVIVNLLRNAWEAMDHNEQGQCISVELEKVEDKAVIKVKDHAKRFSQEDLNKLSEPLGSEKEQGMGLGLQIVKTIVESHGGSITFKKNLDKGLVVSIQLPIERITS